MIHEYIREYLDYKMSLGHSPASIETDKYSLKHLTNYMIQKNEYHLTRSMLMDFAKYLFYDYKKKNHQALSPTSVKRILLTTRGLSTFLTNQKNVFLSNPACDLKGPKIDTLPRNIPTDHEIQATIDSIEPTYMGIRNKAILEILYSTAIRAGELLALDIYDVDFQEKRLSIRQGKGKKDRVVPIGQKAFDALRIYTDYFRSRYLKKTKERALFLTHQGRRMSYHMLVYAIGRVRKDQNIRPHVLRHAAAIGMLKNGADIRYIQQMLGHASLESTQIYTRLLPVDLKDSLKRYHPREKESL